MKTFFSSAPIVFNLICNPALKWIRKLKCPARLSLVIIYCFSHVTMARAEQPTPDSLKGMDQETLSDGLVAQKDAPFLLFLNVDDAVDTEWLEAQRREMRRYLSVPIRVEAAQGAPGRVRSRLEWLQATRSLQPDQANAIIFLIQGGIGSDTGIWVAPDTRWAAVDPEWVATPEIDAETRLLRLGRQLYRATGFLFGVPYTPTPQAVMKPIRSPEELDALSANYFPGNLRNFQMNAREMGLYRMRPLNLIERYHLGQLPPEMMERMRERMEAAKDSEATDAHPPKTEE